MNKTININLGGLFFHIDEEAYKKLRRYLDSISRSLSDDPQGKNEIINDIEMRISELLAMKISDPRQVISTPDIEEIVEIMGKPEDYEAESIFEDELYSNGKRKRARKLYRDGTDKFLGGVCSGLAHYMGIDPIWVRLFFLALLFGGGSGFIIYIIMWILLPEANTTAEKLEMEGEAVNISNIEKRVKKEYQDIENRVKEGDYVNKAKSGTQKFFSGLGKLLAGLLKFIGKTFGVLFIIISGSTLIGLLIGAFSLGSIEILGFTPFWNENPEFFYGGLIPFWLIFTAIFVLSAIPFVLLFILGIRILGNSNPMGKTTGYTLLGLWVIALFIIIFNALDFSSSRVTDNFVVQNHELHLKTKDTLSLKMIGNEDLIGYDDLYRRREEKVINFDGVDYLYSNYVEVDVKESTTGKAYIKVRRKADGRDLVDAANRAESLDYQYEVFENNVALNAYFLTGVENRSRDLEVRVTIYLPEESYLYLDDNTEQFLDRVENVDDIYDQDMAGHYYHMNSQGLKCLDCQLRELNEI
ncbi:MAG: PspC domain-containing protein [Flavobacteriaceae bacterium]